MKDGQEIPDSNNDKLAIVSFSSDNQGCYSCIVVGGQQSIESEPVSLGLGMNSKVLHAINAVLQDNFDLSYVLGCLEIIIYSLNTQQSTYVQKVLQCVLALFFAHTALNTVAVSLEPVPFTWTHHCLSSVSMFFKFRVEIFWGQVARWCDWLGKELTQNITAVTKKDPLWIVFLSPSLHLCPAKAT
jgi:hypothetical protein